MILYDAEKYEQYSEEWWAIRLGIPTASRASEIITAKTGVLSASSKPYISELIADRMGLGEEPTEFKSHWMQRGHDMEDEARRFFTFETGLAVDQVGFVTNENGTAGCSPDSLVLYQGDNEEYPMGGLEIKCVMAKTHIGYLIDGKLPDAYKQQVHFSLAVTQLPVWHWMCYHPELDPLIIQVEPDDYTAKVEKALDQFIIMQCDAMQKLGIK